MSGIEKNCKAFQKSVNSFNGVTEENENERDNIETSDDTNNENEDFILDNTVDNLLENAKDILKSTQFGNI